MKLTKIFIIPFHVQRMQQSIMPLDTSTAYVSCYAAGKDYVDATKKALQKLSDDGLHPKEILQPIHEMSLGSWSEHVQEKWAAYADTLPSQAAFEEAIRKDAVIYGPFGAYS